jgi:TolB-like protein
MLTLAVCCALLPAIAPAAGVPVAVFPLQELGEGRNEVNLPFTRVLAERLAESGNEITSLQTVIAFMANNRIRTVGRLETFHISRVREDLGAAFVLLGTVSQAKERPEPSMGLTLNLVRTYDARTVWSYVGSFSAGDERRVLGIGEPHSVAALQPLLLDEIVESWPWEIINEIQMGGSISVDSIVLQPTQVRPGEEVQARVLLRNVWPAGRAPRVFFKADDQLYAATVSDDGRTYEATWVAGEKNGRSPVTLVLEWPLYNRSETALLGAYVVDGTPPLFEIDLRGTRLHEGRQVFRGELVIIPRLLVRKPLDHWRLAFFSEAGNMEGALDGKGNLPERFIWQGRGTHGPVDDGKYQVVLEAWDKAGNSAKATGEVVLDRSSPDVDLALTQSEEGVVVDLEHKGKVPLAHWRMEMWTKEGKLLTKAEGSELPVKIEVDLPAGDQNQDIRGVILVEDVMGTRVRRKVEDLLPKVKPKAEVKEEKPTGISESWVDEF